MKLKLAIPIFIFFAFIFCSGKVFAESPVPANTSLACDQVANPEFNSLRPYQKNIQCTSEVSDYANYCGNDLTLTDSVTVYYPGSGGNCSTVNGKVVCQYNVSVSKPITIDLSGANLPIMGNTEEVKNSVNTEDVLDDAKKMNEYVSWYLNGVTNQAEYGNSKSDANSVVNFSGPVQKLLPGAILDSQRIQSVNNSKVSNHDQIVVCSKSSLGIIGDILNIGKSIPTECYLGNRIPITLDTDVSRLSDWKDHNLALFNTVTNSLTDGARTVIDTLAKFLPEIPKNIIEQSIAASWNKRTPPLPWDDGTGKPFDTELLYRKAYNEWKGKTCVIVPVANWLFCVENVLVPNKYGDLFEYVPLSGTNDVPGQIKIDSVSSATNPTSDALVTGMSFSNQTPSTLFFAHMEETDTISELLQDTYVPESENKASNPTNVSSEISCNKVEVRSNKGDNLFATSITGNLKYTASFSCEFSATNYETCYNECMLQGGPIEDECRYQCYVSSDTYSTTQSCTKEVKISLSTESSIPLVDDIWSRLVAGSMSIFKRMFPKTNTEGSVGKIIDMAGSTNITYSGAGVEQSDADLKFPHVGGISEYFLKGIQTALRPKGFGENIAFAPNSPELRPDKGVVDCDKNAPDVSSKVPRLISKEDLHKLAIRLEGQEGDMVLECYNDVVSKAIAAGVDPALTLLIWINESGGSNYNLSWQDFGINFSYYKGFTAQLNRFLELPEFYKTDSRWSSCFGKGLDNEMFFSVYYTGQCDTNDVSPGYDYIELINQAWNWYTSCNKPIFPFEASCY